MPPATTPLVTAEALGLILPDGRRLFGDVDLVLDRRRVGLIGPNGVGKSLLLDVLVGLRPPDEGRVHRHGRLAYVRQGPGGAPTRSGAPAPTDVRDPTGPGTVADRLGVRSRIAALQRVLSGGVDSADLDRIGADGWDLPERVAAVLFRLGLGHLSLDRPVATQSGGEATRVALGPATLEAPDLLVLDEPTNDLDADSRDALLASLGDWRDGLLVVSHDRELLRQVDRIVELSGSGAREYGGDYDVYRAVREREAAAAAAELSEAEAALRKAREKARRGRERQERRAARGRRARSEGGVPKILLNARRQRAEGTTARLGRAAGAVTEAAESRAHAAQERLDTVAAPRIDVRPSELPGGKIVLRVEGLSYTPPGSGRPLLDDLDLVLRGPERVAITGPNGSGKTTLLRLVTGELVPDRGRVDLLPAERRVAYLDQRAGILPPGETVLGCFRAAHPEWDEGQARHVLARYLFPGARALAPVEHLSGGERMRAALACVLGGPGTPWLLILDEPTNHLDFPALGTLEQAVAEYDGALLVVSHDRDFLEAVGVGRRLELGGGR